MLFLSLSFILLVPLQLLLFIFALSFLNYILSHNMSHDMSHACIYVGFWATVGYGFLAMFNGIGGQKVEEFCNMRGGSR